MTSGVPQGSFLRLVLFSTFINRLLAHLHGINTVLFADDSTVFVAASSIADISATLSSAITAAYDCFLSSGFRLNVAKTKCMLLHSSQRIPTSALEVQLNGCTIDRVQRYKFLGVIITDTLSWSDHIDQVCSKASRGLNLLRRLAWFLLRSALVCYYNAYVLPHLMYAAPEFGRKTLAFRGAHRWNSLPSNLRNVSHPSSFMSAARVCLLSYEL